MKIWTNNRSNNVHTQRTPRQYRATLHRTTRITLASLLFGRYACLLCTQGRLAARRSDTTPHRPRTAGGASPPAVHGRCSFVFFFYFFFHLTCSSYILVVLLLLQRLLPSYLFFFFFYFFFFFFFFFLLVFLLLLPSFFIFFFFVGVSLPI